MTFGTSIGRENLEGRLLIACKRTFDAGQTRRIIFDTPVPFPIRLPRNRLETITGGFLSATATAVRIRTLP